MLPASAGAVPLDVCPSGCTYTSINAAIAAASPGDTVPIGAGTYRENVVVDKRVRLAGSGTATTIIEPATSAPTCAGVLCGSNIVLVRASGVTIDHLTVDGDNPALTSAQNIGGANIDARVGIATDDTLGVLDDLSVAQVTVRNVFLRGIDARSGGRFDVNESTVANVAGDPAASIGIHAAGGNGAGVVRYSSVTGAGTGISVDHTQGVTLYINTVSGAATGVQVSQSGSTGTVADAILGNTVTACTVDGAGIAVASSQMAPDVKFNHVTGCAVGLAAYAPAAPGTATLLNNDLDGTGALVSAPARSIGVLASTDRPGSSPADGTLAVTGNALRNFYTGLATVQTGGHTESVTTTQNRIAGNTAHGLDSSGGGTITSTDDWWGCNDGPNTPDCDGYAGAGTTVGNYLLLILDTTTSTVQAGGVPASLIAAMRRFDGTTALQFPATPLVFATTQGSVLTPLTTVSGSATSSLSEPGNAVLGGITATVALDNATTPAGFLVTANSGSSSGGGGSGGAAEETPPIDGFNAGSGLGFGVGGGTTGPTINLPTSRAKPLSAAQIAAGRTLADAAAGGPTRLVSQLGAGVLVFRPSGSLTAVDVARLQSARTRAGYPALAIACRAACRPVVTRSLVLDAAKRKKAKTIDLADQHPTIGKGKAEAVRTTLSAANRSAVTAAGGAHLIVKVTVLDTTGVSQATVSIRIRVPR